MRILHTSDWHLGQTLHFFERTHEHQIFLAWLLDLLESERADALLVSGDVFDVANPSSSSQRQFYEFLTGARRRMPRLAIVVIAGNHDSPARLEAPTPFLRILDAEVLGQVPRTPEGGLGVDRLVVPLKGPSGETEAWCLAVPFLRLGDVPRVETDGDAYLEGAAALYRSALEAALLKREKGQAIIAMGHCTLPGMKTVESERPLVFGGLEALPETAFSDEISYVALGHLHLAQHSRNRPHVRYSGSPIPLSFSEMAYRHQVVLVDLEKGLVQNIRQIPVPRPVEFLRCPAAALPLEEALGALAKLERPHLPHDQQPFLEVPVLVDGPQVDRRSRIEEVLRDKPVRLAKITTVSPQQSEGGTAPLAQSLDSLRLDPETVFGSLYQRKYGAGPPAPILHAFAELVSEAHREGE